MNRYVQGQRVVVKLEDEPPRNGVIRLVMDHDELGFEYLIDYDDGDWVVAIEDDVSAIG